MFKVVGSSLTRLRNIGGNGLCQNYLYNVSVRGRSSTPINTIIMFVPQQEAWVVERMGKFHRILDNVTLNIDGVLYLRILNPYLASYGVEDPEFAITQLAQTTMRSELGKISLDNVFRERENLNVGIVESINKASEAWGITCLRYEIRDIKLPARVQEAMQMQVEAERKKRAAILESEGIREADINVAEGKRASKILASEAEKQETINKANGEAQAMLSIADERARGLNIVAKSLCNKEGHDAASLKIAEQYIEAFNKLARTSNTLILPSNAGDVPNAVTQALAVFNTLTKKDSLENSQLKQGIRDPEYYSEDDEEHLKKNTETK